MSSRSGNAGREVVRIAVALSAALMVFVMATAAFADNVVNDVTVGGNDTFTVGGSTTVNYWIVATGGDGQAGCNASDGTAATVTINTPANVTATPGSLVFTGCGTEKMQPVTFTASAPGNYVITVSVSDGGTGTYNTTPGGFTLEVLQATDSTPPVITANIVGALGNNGWYVSDVTVSWTVVDNESAITSTTGCGSTTISTDTAGTTLTCTATSAGGTSSESVTVKRDATPPSLTCPSPDPSFLLNQDPANVTASVSDPTSGPVSTSVSGAANTSSVGIKTISLTGEDNAGNTQSASCSYTVSYKFEGFGSPVNNNGVLNVAKAGQAIPLKWRLLDANDNLVPNLASVKVTVASLSCTLAPTADAVEEYAAGASGLQNLGDGYYQFNWKTPTNYANSCKTMRLDLGEGPTRTALFQFRK